MKRDADLVVKIAAWAVGGIMGCFLIPVWSKIATQPAEQIIEKNSQEIVQAAPKEKPLLLANKTGKAQSVDSSQATQVETKLPSARVILMKVTAYCPCKKCCGDCTDGITSTGRNAWKTLGVAADPKLLPYGTKLEIPGVGLRTVDDAGGAMRQNAEKGIYHIDLRMHSHPEAKKFGVRWLNVKILG